MRKPKLHIIYVPGLGDYYTPLRRPFFKLWRIFGVGTYMVPIKWLGNQTYQEKLAAINAAIKATPHGRLPVLLGESAGSSLVLAAYAQSSVPLIAATICGKNANPHNVSPLLFKRNPAFKIAMQNLEDAVASLTPKKRQAFISFQPLLDDVIPVREMRVPGGKNIRLISVGHFLTVAMALTFYSWFIVRALKKVARQR